MENKVQPTGTSNTNQQLVKRSDYITNLIALCNKGQAHEHFLQFTPATALNALEQGRIIQILAWKKESLRALIFVLKHLFKNLAASFNLKDGLTPAQIDELTPLFIDEFPELTIEEVYLICRKIKTGQAKIYGRLDVQIIFEVAREFMADRLELIYARDKKSRPEPDNAALADILKNLPAVQEARKPDEAPAKTLQKAAWLTFAEQAEHYIVRCEYTAQFIASRMRISAELANLLHDYFIRNSYAHAFGGRVLNNFFDKVIMTEEFKTIMGAIITQHPELFTDASTGSIIKSI